MVGGHGIAPIILPVFLNFRWFKLNHLTGIPIGELPFANWDSSFLTFWVKLRHETLRHIYLRIPIGELPFANWDSSFLTFWVKLRHETLRHIYLRTYFGNFQAAF